MRIRQSDLAAYGRCAQQKRLVDLSRTGEGPAPRQLSATAFGTVMHHALQAMEQLHHQGRTDALEVAQATFVHYWNPANISELTEPVDEWIARQTHGGLQRKGKDSLALHYEYLKGKGANEKLLALELNFNLPMLVDGVWHEISGTVDRLAIKKYQGKSFVSIEDFKTGIQKEHLRWNVQFTMYGWASTQQGFWDQWDNGVDLWKAYQPLGRRGTWINLKNGYKRADAGWRGPQDYARLHVAIREYVRAVEAGIYPLNLDGAVCEYCPFRDTCGGVAVPDKEYGTP